jgi:hypothetical protein
MSDRPQRRSTEIWSGAENIQESFDALGMQYDCHIMTYLQRLGRVVVKNDPILVEVFGQETVDRYEAMLAEHI